MSAPSPRKYIHFTFSASKSAPVVETFCAFEQTPCRLFGMLQELTSENPQKGSALDMGHRSGCFCPPLPSVLSL